MEALEGKVNSDHKARFQPALAAIGATAIFIPTTQFISTFISANLTMSTATAASVGAMGWLAANKLLLTGAVVATATLTTAGVVVGPQVVRNLQGTTQSSSSSSAYSQQISSSATSSGEVDPYEGWLTYENVKAAYTLRHPESFKPVTETRDTSSLIFRPEDGVYFHVYKYDGKLSPQETFNYAAGDTKSEDVSITTESNTVFKGKKTVFTPLATDVVATVDYAVNDTESQLYLLVVMDQSKLAKYEEDMLKIIQSLQITTDLRNQPKLPLSRGVEGVMTREKISDLKSQVYYFEACDLLFKRAADFTSGWYYKTDAGHLDNEQYLEIIYSSREVYYDTAGIFLSCVDNNDRKSTNQVIEELKKSWSTSTITVNGLTERFGIIFTKITAVAKRGAPGEPAAGVFYIAATQDKVYRLGIRKSLVGGEEAESRKLETASKNTNLLQILSTPLSVIGQLPTGWSDQKLAQSCPVFVGVPPLGFTNAFPNNPPKGLPEYNPFDYGGMFWAKTPERSLSASIFSKWAGVEMTHQKYIVDKYIGLDEKVGGLFYVACAPNTSSMSLEKLREAYVLKYVEDIAATSGEDKSKYLASIDQYLGFDKTEISGKIMYRVTHKVGMVLKGTREYIYASPSGIYSINAIATDFFEQGVSREGAYYTDGYKKVKGDLDIMLKSLKFQ